MIYDTFVNPQIQTMALKELGDIFYQNGVWYLSAHPTLHPFYETTPWSQAHENRFRYEAFKDYYAFLEKVWKTCGEENLKRLDVGKSKPSDLRPIQQGYLRIGFHFFVGVKK